MNFVKKHKLVTVVILLFAYLCYTGAVEGFRAPNTQMNGFDVYNKTGPTWDNITSKKYAGAYASQLKKADAAACRQTCKSDSKCVSYHYNPGRKNCNLFDYNMESNLIAKGTNESSGIKGGSATPKQISDPVDDGGSTVQSYYQKNKVGIIVGSTIGGVVLLLLIGFLVYWFVIRKKPFEWDDTSSRTYTSAL